MGGQRGHHHALGTRRQDRSAPGHRVGAGAERRRHDEPVAGDPGVEHVVHAHRDQHLSRSVTGHREIVDGDRAARSVPADVEARDADGRPSAGGDLLERPRQAVGGHRRQHADAAARHAEHRTAARGAGVERREGGPVPSEREEQVAGRGLHRVRHPALHFRHGYLADRHAVRGRPGAELRQQHVERAGRMDDQADPPEGEVRGLVHVHIMVDRPTAGPEPPSPAPPRGSPGWRPRR